MQGLATFLLAALSVLPIALAANRCDVTGLQLVLPANQSVVQPPANATLAAVTLGVGTQNYTCQSSKWVSVGAVASLFDISCLQPIAPIAAVLPEAVNALQTQSSATLVSTLEAFATIAGFKLADHYFDTSVGALSPVFNFAISQGGFVVGKKIEDVPAPLKTDVDWLLLQNVRGTAALLVVREQTAGGQPPQSNCTLEGQPLQVPYSAKYWFYQ